MGKRTKQGRPQRRTILVVTNGAVTEKLYLEYIKERSGIANTTIKIKMQNEEPEAVLRKLRSPNSDTSGYSEIWVVVDEDMSDRQSFMASCRKLSKKNQPWYGIVSRPCFEVWLTAHYGQVRKYADQQDAQRHFAQASGVEGKKLPADFPFVQVGSAIHQCRLPGIPQEPLNELPPSPGTGMPHMIAAFGIAPLPGGVERKANYK